MNKQKCIAIIWLVLLFASGLTVGVCISPQNKIGKSRALISAPEQKWIQQHQYKLISNLDLTPEQLALIDPVYQQTSKRLRDVRENMTGEIRVVVKENRQALMKILTREQIDQFRSILSSN